MCCGDVGAHRHGSRRRRRCYSLTLPRYSTSILDFLEMSVERFAQIPPELRIQILHDDDDIVVIHKPCNLRSVPGNAHPPPASRMFRKKKRPRSDCDEDVNTVKDHHPQHPQHPQQQPPVVQQELSSTRRTGQEAWVLALESFREVDRLQPSIGTIDAIGEQGDQVSMAAHKALQQLALAERLLHSTPRKYKIFRRFVQRNRKRLFPQDDGDDGDIDAITNVMYQLILRRQRPLLNVPEPTRHEDSALGQLILLGYDQTTDKSIAGSPQGRTDKEPIRNMDQSSERLFVVHRLDCQVPYKNKPWKSTSHRICAFFSLVVLLFFFIFLLSQ